MKKRTVITALIVLSVIVLLALLWHAGYSRYLKAAYPLRYQQTVEKYAAQSKLPPSLVFAVIKSESGFNPGALSSIGARGLMQVTPETFWWAQDKTGEKGLSDDALYDPETNIHYGTVILARFITEFKGTDTALAAYHAGRSNVRKWLADSRYSSDGKTLSHIPFADTRAYVKRVLETQRTYAALYHMN